jgi:hypothetical protein
MPTAAGFATMRVKVVVDPIPIQAQVTCAGDRLEGSRKWQRISGRTPAWVNAYRSGPSPSRRRSARQRTAKVPRAAIHVPLVSLASPRLVVGAGRARWAPIERGPLVTVFVRRGDRVIEVRAEESISGSTRP